MSTSKQKTPFFSATWHCGQALKDLEALQAAQSKGGDAAARAEAKRCPVSEHQGFWGSGGSKCGVT